MIQARPCCEFGATRAASMEVLHHFSFAGYQDARRDGWGDLCVINHTLLAPRAELRPQPLDGVEVITMVRCGVLEHLGAFSAGCRTIAGEVQLLSTGTGIEHGCYNPLARAAEYLEIRLRSSERLGQPARAVTAFPTRDQKDRCVLLASGFAEDRPAMRARARARVSVTRLRGGTRCYYPS